MHKIVWFFLYETIYQVFARVQTEEHMPKVTQQQDISAFRRFCFLGL